MNPRPKKKIRVLAVDDSPLIRKILNYMLSDHPEMELVGTAPNGKIALQKIEKLRPDVITLDFEMPVMNGLETLKHIMADMPTPVIMLSSYSEEGADLTFQALDMGAVDFITKPHPVFSQRIEDIQGEILKKIKTASHVRVERVLDYKPRKIVKKPVRQQHPLSARQPGCNHIVSIGVSTGGPKALQQMIPKIPIDIPAAVLIVQHMPPGFTRALAERLNTLSKIQVKEAENGDVVTNGTVLIAPGDQHLTVNKEANRFVARLSRNGYDSPFKPSIDALMVSTSELFQRENTGVIMTGMCSDGVNGVGRIREKGGKVIAQDEKTSVVFGMNKLAIQRGYVDAVVPLDRIVDKMLNMITQ